MERGIATVEGMAQVVRVRVGGLSMSALVRGRTGVGLLMTVSAGVVVRDWEPVLARVGVVVSMLVLMELGLGMGMQMLVLVLVGLRMGLGLLPLVLLLIVVLAVLLRVLETRMGVLLVRRLTSLTSGLMMLEMARKGETWLATMLNWLMKCAPILTRAMASQ